MMEALQETHNRPGLRTSVLGIDIDILGTPDLMTRIASMAETSESHLICYVNAECFNQAVFDRRYRAILHEADIVYADGAGVVWASRLTREPLKQRITLGDALPDLCRMAVARGLRLYLFGGGAGVAQAAAQQLIETFPGLQIAGTHHGYVSEQETASLIAEINQAKPHILLVGLGAPKQEKWMWRHREALQVPVLWGVGALFDYCGGKTPLAPRWIGRLGFEWLFRLLVEPRRLWRRYLFGNAFFIIRTFALLLLDAGLVTCSWLGSYWFWRWLDQPLGFLLNPVDPYLQAVALLVGMWLVTCAAMGLYRRSPAMSMRAELGQVLKATLVGMLSTMAVAFLLRGSSFGRPVVLLFGVLTFLCLSLSRMLARALERRLARRGIGLRRALILGDGLLALRVKEEIETWPAGYDVIGCLAEPAQVASIIQDDRVDDIFVATEALSLHETLNLVSELDEQTANVHIVSPELEALSERVPLSRVAGLPLLHLPSSRPSLGYELIKRFGDILVAIAALLACLPLFGLLAVLIRRESRGPALFMQERVGQRGRLFRMYKFRTMAIDADPYACSPNDLTDPRVTRLGRFLRRWSFDELPQLVNVLQGDMTLIGPRPEMPFLVAQYEPWQQKRLLVKPGLTGLWQVMGRKRLPLQRNIEYDLYYIRHRGWRLDIEILFRTIPAVLFRRGAF
ncbi:MAG: exopolysaccharide biosynthesis polyprenyl glycosylphosphotransferase [Candidatus Omnitrophica bacterium]|nr:exopolysaccharide biosynthesis polyprenyl glycosylphosphotransferase [Candidatus Omnitrophota bacterium]